MKILLLDEDLEIINFLKIIQEKHNYEIVFNDLSMDNYKETQFDMLIVDIAFDKNNDFLSNVLAYNPFQKVIIFSETLDCKNEISCEHCLDTFNKKRLLKPLNFDSFISLIESFDHDKCKYAELNCFENILPIFEKVMKRFSYYKYNSSNNLIYTQQKDTPLLVQQFIEIITLLDKHDIAYDIQDE